MRPVHRADVDNDVFRAALAAWPPPCPNDIASPAVVEDEPESDEMVADVVRPVHDGRLADELVPRARSAASAGLAAQDGPFTGAVVV